MKSQAQLDLVQEILVPVCHSRNPMQTLGESTTRNRGELGPVLVGWLEGIDPEGLEFTAMLIRRHRLDRILEGDPELRDQYQCDPSGFQQDFDLYVDTVVDGQAQASEEAAAFREYMDLLGGF